MFCTKISLISDILRMFYSGSRSNTFTKFIPDLVAVVYLVAVVKMYLVIRLFHLSPHAYGK